jgi:hypothetical protein
VGTGDQTSDERCWVMVADKIGVVGEACRECGQGSAGLWGLWWGSGGLSRKGSETRGTCYGVYGERGLEQEHGGS